jgi:hypothetical protein
MVAAAFVRGQDPRNGSGEAAAVLRRQRYQGQYMLGQVSV